MEVSPPGIAINRVSNIFFPPAIAAAGLIGTIGTVTYIFVKDHASSICTNPLITDSLLDCYAKECRQIFFGICEDAFKDLQRLNLAIEFTALPSVICGLAVCYAICKTKRATNHILSRRLFLREPLRPLSIGGISCVAVSCFNILALIQTLISPKNLASKLFSEVYNCQEVTKKCYNTSLDPSLIDLWKDTLENFRQSDRYLTCLATGVSITALVYYVHKLYAKIQHHHERVVNHQINYGVQILRNPENENPRSVLPTVEMSLMQVGFEIKEAKSDP